MADPTKAVKILEASAAACIIAAVVELVPPPAAPVPELIKARLPKVLSEAQMKKYTAAHHLVDLPISGALSDVFEGPIPHRTWLASLQQELAKPHKTPITAIRHPTRRKLILPLWALPVWDSIVVAAGQRMLWVRAADWLRPDEHRPEDHVEVERARAHMEDIPWGMAVWALPAESARSLIGFHAKLLSSVWLSERNVDLMGVCCNAIAAEDNYKSRGYMATTFLGAKLGWISGWDDQKIRDDTDLTEWTTVAAEKQLRYIHIPVNLANTHWVVFGIDLDNRTYFWGLSLVPTV